MTVEINKTIGIDGYLKKGCIFAAQTNKHTATMNDATKELIEGIAWSYNYHNAKMKLAREQLNCLAETSPEAAALILKELQS